ncbi:hypothetical protein HanPI659440_Chr13g0497951 [Helianthus annuus]|nr:hypothetical protein HanPI659440_Chr13g0497951 [Helianthus annuus]
MLLMPDGKPGHILLPEPNGNNSKSWPLKSNFVTINLSGLKEKGSSQTLGSRPIAHRLTKTFVFFGIV